MLPEPSLQKRRLDAKTVFTNVLIVVNPLVWYYAVISVLQDVIAQMSPDSMAFLVWGVHFSGLIVAALMGNMLTRKIGQRRFLIAWMTLGVIASLALALIDASNILTVILLALLFGVSLGVGMPACMRYYTDGIPVEKRGRISGIIMFTFVISMILLTIVSVNALWILGAVLAVWRLASLVAYLWSKPSPNSPHTEPKQKTAGPSYRQILGQQSFMLYFAPWIMFSLVNYLPTALQASIVGEQTNALLVVIQNGFIGIFGIIGGFLLDYIGRKRIAIAGFVMIGLSASFLGAYPESIFSWYLSTMFGGIAWGFVFVLFILTIWGDMSHSAPSDKYYALGVTPFFVSQFLGLTVGKYIVGDGMSYALFSFTAFFLFLAVLPLVYAPETLPEKTMKDRDLKSYTEKALKQAKKHEEKTPKKGDNDEEEPDESEGEADKNSEEYDEARKLAEKYY